MPALELDHQVEALKADRMTTADGAALLGRLAESGMVEKGQVVLLGLDAIRSRFGDRWSLKGEQVWAVALPHIRRRLGPGDLVSRVGEIDAVIAVGGGRERAQAMAFVILQELLTFFLGEARPEDIKLNAVSWVSGRDIGTAPLDAAGLSLWAPGMTRAPAEPAAFAPPAKTPPEPASPPRPPATWSALTLAVDQGRPLATRFVTQTLIGLRQGLPTGLRLEAQICHPLTGRVLDPALVQLNTVEALALDLATGEFTRGLASQGEDLVAPVSFESVSTARGRGRLLTQAGPGIAAPPIREIIGVDAGTPQGRLTETVALVGKSSQAVVVRVDLGGDLKAKLSVLKAARLGGVSIDLRGLTASDADERLTLFAGLAKGVAGLMYAFSLPSHAMLERAAALGFTHATLNEQG